MLFIHVDESLLCFSLRSCWVTQRGANKVGGKGGNTEMFYLVSYGIIGHCGKKNSSDISHGYVYKYFRIDSLFSSSECQLL